MTKTYNGKKWCVGVRGRYFSVSWDMVTFRECIAYIKDQQANEAAANRLSDFWFWIKGPGGHMDYNTLRELVK